MTDDDIFDRFSEQFFYQGQIAQGSYGKVVKAFDTELKKTVAIKILSKDYLDNNQIQQLRDEAILLSNLQHPNIVQYINLMETESKIFIEMEYMEGGALSNFIKNHQTENKSIPTSSVIQIMKSIANGLYYIHQKNIVHRDLKPDNILISDLEDLTTIKIADFGLSSAKSISNVYSKKCGTYLYMAPELIGQKVYSKQVDIWSCAIILYELLSNGEHPFYKEKHTMEQFQIELEKPKWQFPEYFNSLAVNLILKIGAKDPEQRYNPSQILTHPWITGQYDSEIPLSFQEIQQNFNNEQKLTRIIKTLIFLNLLKYTKKNYNPQLDEYANQCVLIEKKIKKIQSNQEQLNKDKEEKEYIQIIRNTHKLLNINNLNTIQLLPTNNNLNNYYISKKNQQKNKKESIIPQDLSPQNIDGLISYNKQYKNKQNKNLQEKKLKDYDQKYNKKNQIINNQKPQNYNRDESSSDVTKFKTLNPNEKSYRQQSMKQSYSPDINILKRKISLFQDRGKFLPNILNMIPIADNKKSSNQLKLLRLNEGRNLCEFLIQRKFQLPKIF